MAFEVFDPEIMDRARRGLLSPTPIHRLFPNPDLAAMLHGPGEGDALAMAAAALSDVRRIINWPFGCLVEARASWTRYSESPPKRWSPKMRVAGAATQAHKPFIEFVLFGGSMANALASASVFLDGRTTPIGTKENYPTPDLVVNQLKDSHLRQLAEAVVVEPSWKSLFTGRFCYRNRLVHRDLPRLIEHGPGTGYARRPVWKVDADGQSKLKIRGGGDPGEYRIADLLDDGAKVWNSLVRWAHALSDCLADRWLSHPEAEQWDRPGPPILHTEYERSQRSLTPHVSVHWGSSRNDDSESDPEGD